jgi:hypothetical protein
MLIWSKMVLIDDFSIYYLSYFDLQKLPSYGFNFIYMMLFF